VTPNDRGDTDTGANGDQNFPVLGAAVALGATTVVRGTLNTLPSQTLTLRFFSSPACDPSGFGEGKTFLGSSTVHTDGSGNAKFELSLAARTRTGQQVTATATSADGTSEFSACRPVQAAPKFTITPARQRVHEGQRATLTITRSGATGISSTVSFATANGSARAGTDYRARTGTLTFAPGQTTKTIHIQILTDHGTEPDQQFTVSLRTPVHAILGHPATATIVIPR
jgi:hypothetical protein